jgi:DNA invertase Pin-like site-specific DNA recombinase
MTESSEHTNKTPVSVAIYARVASVKEGSENSAANAQLESARQHAKRKGWRVHKEYVDLRASGVSDKGRPQFDLMMIDALKSESPFAVVLAYDQDRFYRDALRLHIMKAELLRHGVEVECVVQPSEHEPITSATLRAAFAEHGK